MLVSSLLLVLVLATVSLLMNVAGEFVYVDWAIIGTAVLTLFFLVSTRLAGRSRGGLS